LLSENMMFDIREGDTFKGHFRLPSDYATGGAIVGEGGALDVGIRFLPVPEEAMIAGSCVEEDGGAAGDMSVIDSASGTVADVHHAICIGQEAVAGINLGGQNGGVLRKALGSGGSSDPLDQRQTIGWKKYDARVVLNQAFFATVQAAVSL
jgi:N4-gp56 family major capsid protein